MRTKTTLPGSKDHDANALPQKQPVTVADQVNAHDLPASLARLQCTHGNRFVQKLLRSRLIQAKLTVSEPGDQFEQEAERVSDQVMRMADPLSAEAGTTRQETQVPLIQRMCSQCDQEIHRQEIEDEEEEEVTRRAPLMLQRVCGECEEELHRQQDEPGSEPPSEETAALVHNVLGSPGRALDSQARAFFEPRFDRDFGAVRVHTDESAAESAGAVNARAYTFGNHIVFGPGQFNADTDSGRRLLAHELVHVVQQAPQTVARKVRGESRDRAVQNEELASDAVSVHALTQDGHVGSVFRQLAPARECRVASGIGYTPASPAVVAGGAGSTTHFAFRADFEDDHPNNVFASCCQVRQFIRWNAAAAAGMGPNGVPHAGFPAGTPVDTFIEDRDAADHRYGHRAGAHSDPQDFDQYLDGAGNRNQASGHRYRGTDDPTVPPAMAVGQWRFYVKVIDRCNRGRRVGDDSVIRINW
jgi:hypothetical protein